MPSSAIIEADLGTQVISISFRGFDTHANQLTTQAGLLDDRGSGIAGLFERLTFRVTLTGRC